MAPFDEPHHLRWQRQAKRAFGATLPDWTIADDSDDYDVHIMKPRVRRSNVPTSSREPEVMINILREPYAKRTDTVDPATEKQKQDAKKEESSDSESEGDDAADSGSESESEDEDEEPKKGKEGQTSNDGNLNIKLPASSTNSPSVDAPSAEGSMSDSPLVSQILDPLDHHAQVVSD